MKNRMMTTLLLTSLAGALVAAPRQVETTGVEIEDADTLLVEVDGVSYRIQLPGIDAPESSVNPKLQRDVQRTGLDAEVLLALGRAADAGLQGLLETSGPFVLSFDPDNRDRYGRVPGELLDTGGRALSLRLVETGYAIPAGDAQGRAAELDAALAAAKSGGRGLWGLDPETFAAWAGPIDTPVPAR